MVGIAAGDRMVLEIAEPLREGDMLGFGDELVAQEQHLVVEKRLADRAEEIVIPDGFGEIHADELRANERGELLDAHQMTKIEEPVVLPDSMSLCARTASSSS